MKCKIKALAIFLCTSYILFQTGCKTEEVKPEESSTPVKVYTAQEEVLSQYLKMTGTIIAGKDQVVFSKTSERIEQLSIKPGDRVTANQIIAKQFGSIFKQGVAAAEANVANASAQYELAKLTFKRMERLYAQQAVSTQQFEQTTMQYKAALAGLEAAQAQLKQATEQFENTLIKAPFSGVVAAVFVELSQMVPAGQQIAQIIDPSIMKSKIRISGKEIRQIKKGLEAEIVIPSLLGKKYKGRVISIDQAVDPVSKSLEAEVRITNPDKELKSGMYAEFIIKTASVENSIIVPETAIITQTEVQINKQTGTQQNTKRFFLYVVLDNRAVMKEVKIGLISDSRVEILSGINFNDKIIVVGNNLVQDNQLVRIVE